MNRRKFMGRLEVPISSSLRFRISDTKVIVSSRYKPSQLIRREEKLSDALVVLVVMCGNRVISKSNETVDYKIFALLNT